MSDLPKANQRITADERACILHLHDCGLSANAIAGAVKRSRKSVTMIIRNSRGVPSAPEPRKSPAYPGFVERLLQVHPGAIDGRYERAVPPSLRKPLTGAEVARSLPWLGLKI